MSPTGNSPPTASDEGSDPSGALAHPRSSSERPPRTLTAPCALESESGPVTPSLSPSGTCLTVVVGTARCAVRTPYEGRNVCLAYTCDAIGSARSDAGGDIATRCPSPAKQVPPSEGERVPEGRERGRFMG